MHAAARCSRSRTAVILVAAIGVLLGVMPGAAASFVDPALANHGGPPPRPQRGGNYTGGHFAGRGVLAFGAAGFYGDASSPRLPVVAMAPTPTGRGYWLATAEGVVYPFGDAASVGSVAGPLRAPIVAMAATPTGHGYWLVALDGGVFAFGDAPYLGSMGGTQLRQPIVAVAATPDGRGYWMVAADGGVFSFGDAPFLGSMGGAHLYAPVVGMATTPTGKGYWEVASDGGVFRFGDARFLGSTGGSTLDASVDGIAPTQSGRGYWLVADDGSVFSFGDAGFYGSDAAAAPTPAVAGIVALPSGKGYWLLAPGLMAPTFGGTSAILNAASSQLGGNPVSGWFCNPYGPCEEWCALFATWAWEQAGVPIGRDGFVGDIFTWAANHAGVLGAGAQPSPGDAVLYGTGPQSTSTALHVALVAAVWPDGAIITIDGDDGPGPPGRADVVLNGPFLPSEAGAYRGMPIFAYAVP